MSQALGDRKAVRPGQSWGAHLAATVTLGLPLVGAQLAQMAINTTDIVFLGRLGATDLAAGVFGTQTLFFFYIFGSGFTNAVMPMAAHAHGRGDATSVRRAVRMGMWVGRPLRRADADPDAFHRERSSLPSARSRRWPSARATT